MKKLAIITTHPIQYNAPLFRLLTEREVVKPVVFYTWGESVLETKFDPGFRQEVQWDIPLLEGYEYRFPENTSATPGSKHYSGIINPGLIQDLEELRPDAILVYGWNFKSHLAVMRKFHGKVPVIFRGDSTIMKDSGLRKILKRFVLSSVYRNVDHFLYAGKRNREYFEFAGANPGQLTFMPHAIDNGRFSNNRFDAEANELKKELGILPGAITFLYAGKIDENKNVGLLAEVFFSIATNNHYLVIAGDGSQKEKLLATYGRHQSIKFLPFQNQAKMPVIYRLADFFVLPSLSETWGLAINEAFACSRAVICSDACGAAVDLVHEGETGFVFRSNDKNDLKIKLTAASQPGVAEKLGKNASGLISEWNYEKAAMAIETTLVNAGIKRSA